MSELIELSPGVFALQQYNRSQRKNYPKIYLAKENKDGSTEHTFPFLTQPDPRDVELFKQLTRIEPWRANKETIKSWQKVAQGLKNAKGDDGLPLFLTVSGKSAKDRFDKVCGDMKQWMASSPWRDGCDEDDLSPFVLMVEDILKKYYAFTVEKHHAKLKSLVEDETEQDDSDGMRASASIDLSRDENLKLLPATMKAPPAVDLSIRDENQQLRAALRAWSVDLPRDENRKLPATVRASLVDLSRDENQKLPARTPVSGSNSPTNDAFKINNSMDVATELLKSKQEIRLQRLAIKRKQQDLESKKLDLDRERFEEEKKQRQFDREQQHEMQKAHLKLIMTMVGMLRGGASADTSGSNM